MTPYLTSAGLGLLLALGIFWLVRRDRLHGRYALGWLLIAAASLALGFFPRSIDWLGRLLGVNYPPMLLVLVALIAILLKLLGLDIDVTRRERSLRRLMQKIAILELELRTLRATTAAPASRSPESGSDDNDGRKARNERDPPSAAG